MTDSLIKACDPFSNYQSSKSFFDFKMMSILYKTIVFILVLSNGICL